MPDFVPLVQSLQKLMVVGGYGRIANQGLSKAGIGHIYFAPPPPRIMTNVLSLSVPITSLPVPPSYFSYVLGITINQSYWTPEIIRPVPAPLAPVGM